MVEKTRLFFQQTQKEIATFWKGLSRGRRMGLGIALLVIFSAFAAALMWRPEKDYEVAFTNLSQEDRTAILAFLKKAQVTEFKLEGDTLSFPMGQVLDAKMKLAEEGLPSSGAGVGWEKFDEQAFGATDFDQKVNKLRAIQGELQRTINRLEPVETSRVHIVLPEQAVFADEKKQTTASISIRFKPGKNLTQRQIQGILHLVARAVEGLDPQNIAIVDGEGNMLTRPEEEDGGLDRVTSAQRDYQKKVERELSSKIREILGRVVGFNKVVATVQAEIDFKQVETTIQDVDPERSAVVSSVRNEQTSGGTGMNPTGVPGAKSNLPGEKEDLAAGGTVGTNSKQSNETLNFEFKKTLSKVVEPVGSLKKLSAAVLVDAKIAEGKGVARSPEEMAMITKLVKSAIGFQEGRDALSVETTQFELDEMAVAEKESLTARRTSLLQTGIIALVAITGMIFLFFAVIKPYFRWLTFDPEKRSKDQFAVVDYELERSGSAAKRVQVHEEVPFEKLSTKEQIMYLARHDPKKTTEALRQLLSPNHTPS
jgi:flagellar M-ring protein FliF